MLACSAVLNLWGPAAILFSTRWVAWQALAKLSAMLLIALSDVGMTRGTFLTQAVPEAENRLLTSSRNETKSLWQWTREDIVPLRSSSARLASRCALTLSVSYAMKQRQELKNASPGSRGLRS